MQEAAVSGTLTGKVATIALAAAIVVAAFAVAAYTLSGDTARPSIVVRSGGVIFDGGDAQDPRKHWKDWKRDSPEVRRWRPDQPGGESVAAFAVTMTGSTAASCAAALKGTDVLVGYTISSSNTTTRLRLTRDRVNASGADRWEPVIEAPSSLAMVPGTPMDPPQLVYNPGDGWISSVMVDKTECRFSRPMSDAERNSLRITVTPVK
jgi:hypothetical protein